MRYLITEQDHEVREFNIRAEKRMEYIEDMLKRELITLEEYDREMDLLQDDIEGFYAK